MEGAGGFKKEYPASNLSCRITFRLPKDAMGPARKVTVVGDFNNWDREASPMKKRRNGDFETTLELPAGKEYRFRYLINGHRWEMIGVPISMNRIRGCDDSVIIA